MVDYNLVLYVGIALIVFWFIYFLLQIHWEREEELKQFRQQQLNKSFERDIKLNPTYKRKLIKRMKGI